jgi:hypothetical protein
LFNILGEADNMSNTKKEPGLGQDKILIKDRDEKHKMIVFQEFEEEGENIIIENEVEKLAKQKKVK